MSGTAVGTGIGTAIGIGIVYLAFILWPNRDEAGVGSGDSPPAEPGTEPAPAPAPTR